MGGYGTVGVTVEQAGSGKPRRSLRAPTTTPPCPTASRRALMAQLRARTNVSAKCRDRATRPGDVRGIRLRTFAANCCGDPDPSDEARR